MAYKGSSAPGPETSLGTTVSEDEQPGVTNGTLQNPLAFMSLENVREDAKQFAGQQGLTTYTDTFVKGSLLAKVSNIPMGFESIVELSEEEKDLIRSETTHRWAAQPKMLYFLCAVCAGCAIVQGMDQTITNGAQRFYMAYFGIKNKSTQGLINGAPYLSAALVGCWLNAPLNKCFGRRGTLFASCMLAFAANLWQAVSPAWWSLLLGRFVLGLAVGAKSSTTPVFAAECAPKNIRGALTMMWQMWTAFGIMLGFISSLAFQRLAVLGPNTQWRWMIGSTAIPPFIVGSLVFLLPESPRWYMDKENVPMAFASLQRLRRSDLQAARDLYLAWKYLQVERGTKREGNVLRQFFTERRNWRAAQSSWFCMFMQQFCGVNVIAYYSTEIFTNAGYGHSKALLASFGGGAINWIFALPAIWTIDTFGRRNLLLVTFPAMSICLLWTGLNFYVQNDTVRLPLLATSIYLFMAVYSPGLGPVPFTYSAEAFPLHIRSLGMASATAITWGFNFLISFTWPNMQRAFTPSGAFFWYAAWNTLGWVFAYFFLPETKALSLEELDTVFGMRNRDHARYYAKYLFNDIKRMMGNDVEPMPPLYEVDTDIREANVMEPGPSKRND